MQYRSPSPDERQMGRPTCFTNELYFYFSFFNINLFILIGVNYFTILYWFCHTSKWVLIIFPLGSVYFIMKLDLHSQRLWFLVNVKVASAAHILLLFTTHLGWCWLTLGILWCSVRTTNWLTNTEISTILWFFSIHKHILVIF